MELHRLETLAKKQACRTTNVEELNVSAVYWVEAQCGHFIGVTPLENNFSILSSVMFTLLCQGLNSGFELTDSLVLSTGYVPCVLDPCSLPEPSF